MKSQNRRNQVFYDYFCLMMEESGSWFGSGSVSHTGGPKTYGSGFRTLEFAIVSVMNVQRLQLISIFANFVIFPCSKADFYPPLFIF